MSRAASGSRRNRGVTLLAAAAAFWALTGPGPLAFHWVPLLCGLVYVAVAAAGGRRGGLWAPAAVLCAWGAAVVAITEGTLVLPTTPTYVVAVGVGVVVAALLEKEGFAVDLLRTGVAVLVVGLVYLLAVEHGDVLGRTDTYALAFAAWGVAELARR